ncbi:MAG: hypothetical protein PHU25_20495 [Deltaproteobacteria bacterium]|nr:hypothetical protein [Deltaproteobacteria bacterium]
MIAEPVAKDAKYWQSLAERLSRELKLEDEPDARNALLHALYRILGDRLDKREAAAAHLDAAVGEESGRTDALFDWWREAIVRRGPERCIAALERLASVGGRPEDVAACSLRLSRLKAAHLGDGEGAGAALEAASAALPGHYGVLLDRALRALAQGDPAAARGELTRLFETTVDPVLKAALLTQAAILARRLGVPAAEREPALAAILELPGAGFESLNEVLRSSADPGESVVHARALERLAEVALEREPEPVADRPAGHSFTGLDRGPKVAAAFLWLASLVHERRLEAPDKALAALEKALELAPETPFLELERVRLLEALGRHEEALAAVPASASDAWKIELALMAGKTDAAAALAMSIGSSTGSELVAVLGDLVGTTGDSPAPADGPTEATLSWFLAHPMHEEAPAAAARLREHGIDILPVLRSIEENAPAKGPWPLPDATSDGELWPEAVACLRALDGKPAAEVAQAYLAWAGRSQDPRVQGPLTTAAAERVEESFDLAKAETLYRRALEMDPEQPSATTALHRILRRLGRPKELAELLASVAERSPEPMLAAEALHERALLLSRVMGDDAAATLAYASLVEREPEDVAASFALARLACNTGDWNLAVRELSRLAELCPADAARLHLVAGEILLLVLGRHEEALLHLGKAADAADEPLAATARLHRLFALHGEGDPSALDQALRDEALHAPPELAALWLPEMLEAGREARGAAAVAGSLEGGEPTILRLLWALMAGADLRDPAALQRALHDLTEVIPQGAMSAACRVAAALVEGKSGALSAGLGAADLESPEALWHVADRLVPSDDALYRAEIYRQRAAMAAAHDKLEAADWRLALAEAQEDSGDLAQAIATIETALEEAPDHLGLLFARARLTEQAGRFPEAIESRRKLAGVLAAPEEKGNELAEAARIMLHELGDARAAEKLCREILERLPAHAATHEILTRILRDRGDDMGLAELTEVRIGTEEDETELVTLYEDKADQLLAADDVDGALAAIDELLALKPDRLPPYHTKIDILAVAGRWDEALVVMKRFLKRCEEPVEHRMMAWRAAEVMAEELGDPKGAMAMLKSLVERGDAHPRTEQDLVGLARRAGDWEEAAAALTRLAALVEEPARRMEVLEEEAAVRLERLFDTDGATAAFDAVLAIDPRRVSIIDRLAELLEPEEMQERLARTAEALRVGIEADPLDVALVSGLARVASLADDEETAAACESVLAALEGRPGDESSAERVPSGSVDAARLRSLLAHADATCPAATVALLAAEMAASVFEGRTAAPPVGKTTLVPRKAADPVRDFVLAWGKALGLEDVEFHRAGSTTAVALARSAPAVAVSPDVMFPLGASERFLLARSVYRAADGLGAFVDGDLAMPVRWVMAVASAALDENARLPVPTDRELVDRARKAMSRKQRRALEEPCRALLDQDAVSLRQWAQAASYGADRFGLLAAGDLARVLPLVAEDAASAEGVKKLAENRVKACGRIPRCKEIVAFALSRDSLGALRDLGLEGPSNGGGA